VGASVDYTNGTSFNKNHYAAWLYAESLVVVLEVYINEHGFNKPKFTCSVAKYNKAHIRMAFVSAAGQEL
jgi:hypothetical protein